MSVEAEQATVASAISSAEQYDTLSQLVSSADFLDDAVRCIWDANQALREHGREVDSVILAAFLDAMPRWQELSKGVAITYIDALLESAQSYQSAAVYAEIVKKASTDRKLCSYAETVKEIAHDGQLDSDQKIGEAQQKLTELSDEVPDGFITYRQAARDACMDILAQIDRGDGLSGLSTGFNAIDEITSGLQDSDLIYVGARPSMGKTTYMMNIANFVAREHPVLVFSLEMPSSGLAKRTLSDFANINMRDLMRGDISEQQKPLLMAAGKQMADLKLRIDDSAGLSVDQLRTRARIAARKEKPRLICIDYLTLMKGKGDNKHLEVGYISKSLKAMAKELSCPVVCLAQLNRSIDSRADKRPILSDLRESGSIEEDADVVMFLYRDEVYDKDSERSGVLEVNVAKHRNGEIGTRLLESDLSRQRFKNLTKFVPDVIAKPKSKRGPLAGVLSGNAAVNDAKGF